MINKYLCPNIGLYHTNPMNQKILMKQILNKMIYYMTYNLSNYITSIVNYYLTIWIDIAYLMTIFMSIYLRKDLMKKQPKSSPICNMIIYWFPDLNITQISFIFYNVLLFYPSSYQNFILKIKLESKILFIIFNVNMFYILWPK